MAHTLTLIFSLWKNVDAVDVEFNLHIFGCLESNHLIHTNNPDKNSKLHKYPLGLCVRVLVLLPLTERSGNRIGISYYRVQSSACVFLCQCDSCFGSQSKHGTNVVRNGVCNWSSSRAVSTFHHCRLSNGSFGSVLAHSFSWRFVCNFVPLRTRAGGAN